MKDILLKNFVFLSSAELISKCINFVIIIFIARFFTIEEFGAIGFITAILSYFHLLINFGFDIYAIREVSSAANSFNIILERIFNIKFLLSIILFVIILLISPILIPSDKLNLMILYSLTLLLIPFNFYWYFQAKERMNIIFYSRIIENVLFLIVSIILILIFKTILIIPISILFSQAISYTLYFRNIEVLPKLSFKKKLLNFKDVLQNSYFSGLSSLFILVYYNLDTIMIGYIKSDTEVGIYQAAYRVILLLGIIQSALNQTITPKFSKLWYKNKEQLKKIANILMILMLIISAIMTVFIYFFADVIINILYGPKFLESVFVLQILIFAMMFVYNECISVPILNAAGKQKYLFYSVGIGALINIIFNLILIPKYSIIGAAISTIVAEIFVYSTLYYFSWKILKFEIKNYLKTLLLICISLIIFFFFPNKIGAIFFIMITSSMLIYFLKRMNILKQFKFVSK